MIRTEFIPIRSINNEWKKWRKRIKPAFDRDDFWNLDDIKSLLMSGDMRLVVLHENSKELYMIIRVVEHTHKKILEVVSLSGVLVDAKQLVEIAIKIARTEKCDELLASGRKGWTRIFDSIDLDVIVTTLYRVKIEEE